MTRWWHKFFIVSFLFIAGQIVAIASAPAEAAGQQVIIAIDAGHGGKDPGAIGQNGLREKDVNFAVARQLYALLVADPMFKPVLTRNSDRFISVAGRSDIARDKNAHLLVSIHADAAQNNSAKGSSVWVLSNKRADSEMGRWLEQQEKQSELLGGGGDALSRGETNPYLSQAVIDLQFANSQRVGYTVATTLLDELKSLGNLHKREPEHASFGILRSPDIPSVLIEVGFISNAHEERLLGSVAHQNKLARTIYQGLRRHFLENPLQPERGTTSTTATISQPAANPRSAVQTEPAVKKGAITQPVATVPAVSTTAAQIHVVESGQTLFGIARRYGSSVAELRALNKLKKEDVWVGQRLKVPAGNSLTSIMPKTAVKTNPAKIARKVKKHVVLKGDSLSMIAEKYGVSMDAVMQANKMNSKTVKLGQSLIIP